MMTVLSGSSSESVAGVAVSQACEGDGPYDVTGKLSFVSDQAGFAPGAKVYVDALNAGIPKAFSDNPVSAPARRVLGPVGDIKLYYYAAGQTVGYGALGLGYNRSVTLSRGLSVEFDGGVAATGNVDAVNANDVRVDQLIKNLNGRIKLDFAPWLGVYSGYRWSEGRGDETRWQQVRSELRGKAFAARSDCDAGVVRMQGLEYGLTLRPLNWLGVSAGYIPSYRADYGSLGVRSQPGYTAELRVGRSNAAARVRGTYSDGYWLADLGVTIK